jgi:hypothetical protein
MDQMLLFDLMDIVLRHDRKGQCMRMGKVGWWISG